MPKPFMVSRLSFPHPVSDTDFCKDVFRFCRIFFNFPPDICHIYAEDLVSASKLEELQDAAHRIAQAHYDYTWVIGFVVSSETYHALSNRVHNFRQGFVNCDELRFLGYAKPYTWFLQD